MVSLEGIRLKRQLAGAIIERLSQAAQAHLGNAECYAVKQVTDPDTGEVILRAEVRKAVPPEWAIDASCAAYLFRSALDNLAWSLALLETPSPFRRTAFPIVDEQSRWARRCRGKEDPLQSLSLRHRSIIENMQPYNSARDARADPLWLLSELNNADKHRLVQLAAVGASKVTQHFGQGVYLGSQEESDGFMRMMLGSMLRVIDDGTELGRFPKGTCVNAEISVALRFRGGCRTVEGREVLPLLRAVDSRVTEIVNIFEHELRSNRAPT